mmetsp:Transcript_51164/g.91951  ORF Transcript_51164/g.91951 Transcript_51164/m.91951 type:complete len:343 (+) Transcript_51164:173-1201(+)
MLRSPVLLLVAILSTLPSSGPAVHVSSPHGQPDATDSRFSREGSLSEVASETLQELDSGHATSQELTERKAKFEREAKLTAIFRSLVAGLSTSLGAGIVLLLQGLPTPAQMAFALALAAGVMLTVSCVELFGAAMLEAETRLQAVLFTAAGLLSFLILRKFVPEPDVAPSKKDEDSADSELGTVDTSSDSKSRQMRLAFLMMVALTAHNFPEGLAVGVSSLQSDRLGLVVMGAIAVHNIPEGIAIAMPVLDATGSRMRAMQMATLSGLAEPLGALIAVSFLPDNPSHGKGVTEALLYIVGGIMTAVALVELLPEAWAQQQTVSTISGLILGCGIMLLTHELA